MFLAPITYEENVMWKVATSVILLVVMVMTGYLTMMATLVYWEGKPRGDDPKYGLLSIAVGICGFLTPGAVVWYLRKRGTINSQSE